MFVPIEVRFIYFLTVCPSSYKSALSRLALGYPELTQSIGKLKQASLANMIYTLLGGRAAVGKQNMVRDTANNKFLESASVSFEDPDDYRLSGIQMQTGEMCFRTAQSDHLT